MTIREPTDQAISDAVRTLRTGNLVAMPTETVYGLAGDATNPAAVAAIYAAKGRPRFNPLIAHVADGDAARRHGELDARADALAAAFWPGPLTLVVPRRADSPIAELACAGLATVALRAPAHPTAQALLRAFAAPLAAPSANRSGRVSPTTAQHVAEDFSADLTILDGGPCQAGVESTIVAVMPDMPPRLLRPGALSRGALEAIIGPLAAPSGAIEAPGMLSSHYAPRARLRLNAVAPQPGEAYLGFGPYTAPAAATLSARGDLQEAAAALYAALRALDAQGPAVIAVAPIPEHGLGEAINDRLARAAAPR
jgi:L-threonylcarbamoyladenylate synthase